MLDDYDRGTMVNQALEHLQKRLDIGRMKADRRLVEDEYGVTLSTARLAGKLQALGLTAG